MAPKKIILIRHGQAQHNIDPPKNYGIADPRLTELGEGQCRKIKIGVDVVCVSPLQRCLQTMQLGITNLQKTQVIVLPELQELGPEACDIPGDWKPKKEANPTYDWTRCEKDADYNTKRGIYTPEMATSRRRCQIIFELLQTDAKYDGREVALICHGGIISFLQGIEDEYEEMTEDKIFSNAEARAFSLVRADDGIYHLNPTECEQCDRNNGTSRGTTVKAVLKAVSSP